MLISLTLTAEGLSKDISFDDELHSIRYGSANNDPTLFEILDNEQRVLERFSVDESHAEVTQLLKRARNMTQHYMAVVTPHKNHTFDYLRFNAKMEELGFNPYAIAVQGGRVELPQGVYIFDNSLPSNSHLNHTLETVRQEIRQAIDSSTSDPSQQPIDLNAPQHFL